MHHHSSILLWDCSIFTVSVSLELINEPGVDCPGDIISYVCSIRSNSENLYLTWHVTFPGLRTINVTFDNNTDLNDVNLPLNTSISLMNYTLDEYVESTVFFLVDDAIPVNGTEVECETGNYNRSIAILSINSHRK